MCNPVSASASELNLKDPSICGPCASQVFPTSLLVLVVDPFLDDCGADLHFALKTWLSGCLKNVQIGLLMIQELLAPRP